MARLLAVVTALVASGDLPIGTNALHLRGDPPAGKEGDLTGAGAGSSGSGAPAGEEQKGSEVQIEVVEEPAAQEDKPAAVEETKEETPVEEKKEETAPVEEPKAEDKKAEGDLQGDDEEHNSGEAAVLEVQDAGGDGGADVVPISKHTQGGSGDDTGANPVAVLDDTMPLKTDTADTETPAGDGSGAPAAKEEEENKGEGNQAPNGDGSGATGTGEPAPAAPVAELRRGTAVEKKTWSEKIVDKVFPLEHGYERTQEFREMPLYKRIWAHHIFGWASPKLWYQAARGDRKGGLYPLPSEDQPEQQEGAQPEGEEPKVGGAKEDEEPTLTGGEDKDPKVGGEDKEEEDKEEENGTKED